MAQQFASNPLQTMATYNAMNPEVFINRNPSMMSAGMAGWNAGVDRSLAREDMELRQADAKRMRDIQESEAKRRNEALLLEMKMAQARLDEQQRQRLLAEQTAKAYLDANAMPVPTSLTGLQQGNMIQVTPTQLTEDQFMQQSGQGITKSDFGTLSPASLQTEAIDLSNPINVGQPQIGFGQFEAQPSANAIPAFNQAPQVEVNPLAAMELTREKQMQLNENPLSIADLNRTMTADGLPAEARAKVLSMMKEDIDRNETAKAIRDYQAQVKEADRMAKAQEGILNRATKLEAARIGAEARTGNKTGNKADKTELDNIRKQYVGSIGNNQFQAYLPSGKPITEKIEGVESPKVFNNEIEAAMAVQSAMEYEARQAEAAKRGLTVDNETQKTTTKTTEIAPVTPVEAKPLTVREKTSKIIEAVPTYTATRDLSGTGVSRFFDDELTSYEDTQTDKAIPQKVKSYMDDKINPYIDTLEQDIKANNYSNKEIDAIIARARKAIGSSLLVGNSSSSLPVIGLSGVKNFITNPVDTTIKAGVSRESIDRLEKRLNALKK